jgi:lipoyl-dependent peroxiredoxin subunit D
MMPLEALRQSLPEFARDIRLNLGSLLVLDSDTTLTEPQRWGCAIAAAFAVRNRILLQAIESTAYYKIEPTVIAAARLSATIMGMTNIYYRAVHIAGDADLSGSAAGLRMNSLAEHGIDPAAFELFGLAASAVNGCEVCVKAHITVARKHGVDTQAIQTAIRIAAIIHATACVLDAHPSPS